MDKKLYVYLGIVVTIAVLIGIIFYVLPSGDAVGVRPSNFNF